MVHYKRMQDQGDILISTLATLLPFSVVRISLGFILQDWGIRMLVCGLVFHTLYSLTLIECLAFGLCGK